MGAIVSFDFFGRNFGYDFDSHLQLDIHNAKITTKLYTISLIQYVLTPELLDSFRFN